MDLERDPRAVATERKYDEIDESRDRQAKALEKLENRQLARAGMTVKDKPLCERCGEPLHGKTHGYCDDCTRKREAGEIPPKHRADPDYAQRRCACGNWFEPDSARGTKCRQCKEKEHPMTHTPPKRKRYSPQAKALYVNKVNEFRLKMPLKEAFVKAGEIALGKPGNHASYFEWRKALGIPTPEGRKSMGNPNMKSPYTIDQRKEFVERVDALCASGKLTKTTACEKVGKEMFGKELKTYNYRDFADAVGKRDMISKPPVINARGHRMYTDEERAAFVERIDEMRSRDITTDEACEKVGKEMFGRKLYSASFFKWRKKLAATKPATQPKAEPKAVAAHMTVDTVAAWLQDVDDADVLINLQDILDVRKAEVHDAIEEQAEMLLAQLSKLSPRKPKAEAPKNDVLCTGQGEPTSSAE